MSFTLNPSLSFPITVTVYLDSFRRMSLEIYLTVTSLMTDHMGVSSFSPGRFRVFWTKATDDWNLQRTGSPVASCVFLSIFLPLFLSSKCRNTDWAWKVPGWSVLYFCAVTPKTVTFTYLQDIIAKNNPGMERFVIDNCMLVMAPWKNWRRKKGLKYFSCFFVGSLLLQTLNWNCSCRSFFPYFSFLGLFWFFALNSSATLSMAYLVVPWAKLI